MKSIYLFFSIALSSVFLLLSCENGDRIVDNSFRNSGFDSTTHIISHHPGFIVETILEADGEYLSMCLDPQKRFLISPRKGKLLRIDIVDYNTGQIEIDTLDIGVTDAQGIKYAFDHLYIMGSGPDGRGIYKLLDSTSLGDYGTPKLIREFTKNGDHSGHAIAIGQDSLLYFLSGNENKLSMTDSTISYITTIWEEDQLLPMNAGWGLHYKAPGGFVLRFDRNDDNWEFLTGGLRNPYDLTFNAHGDLFTFDSDMEWDFNLPWYRATRVNHLVTGADFAWRQGTGKKFDFYPDTWPAVCEAGRGSPTGLLSGHELAFPARYQNSLILGDWSFGRIFTMPFEEKGATYSGNPDLFLSGKPLNVTDMIAGPDSALYFVTGGNGTGTGFYRVAYIGDESVKPTEQTLPPQKTLRNHIESLMVQEGPALVDSALNYLDHEDFWIRSAARILLEKQPATSWTDKALSENRPNAKTQAILSLIRLDNDSLSSEIFEKINSLAFKEGVDNSNLELIRLYNLFFTRFQNQELLPQVFDQMFEYLGSDDSLQDKELCRLLAYTSAEDDSRGAKYINKVIEMAESTDDQNQFIHYLWCLRITKSGWTSGTAGAFKHWIDYANRNLKGGSLYAYTIAEIDKIHNENMLLNIDFDVSSLVSAPLNPEAQGPVPPAPIMNNVSNFASRPFVKNWQVNDLEYSLELVNSPRNPDLRDFENGRKMLRVGRCYDCHFMKDLGSSFGPDLTGASTTFTTKDLLTAIIDPSKDINSRFQATLYQLKNGDYEQGRLWTEDGKNITIQLNEKETSRKSIEKRQIKSEKPATTSEMPPGLLNTMTEDDILDMLYFINHRGEKITDHSTCQIVIEPEVANNDDSSWVEIVTYNPEAVIYYTLDGTDPDSESLKYQNGFYLKEDTQIKAIAISSKDSSSIHINSAHFIDLEANGVHFSYYEGRWNSWPDFDNLSPIQSGVTRTVSLNDLYRRPNEFGYRFSTKINIPKSGNYQFFLHSDGASKLKINGREIVDHPYSGGKKEVSGSVYLTSGNHELIVDYYDKHSYQFLEVLWTPPGSKKERIPARYYYKDILQ